MFSAKISDHTISAETPEIGELRDSVRVLAEVIRHMAERIEILEARDALYRLRPAEG